MTETLRSPTPAAEPSQTRRCPALLIAAPASGQGKTTVTAALARHYRNQGLRVRVFKCGPDFLDPMILERACGAPVYPLDLWMVGEEECRRRLWQAAGEADLLLIEGVMGLFDGSPSAADLARRFGVPVLAVIDGSAMAQTFAAIAHGLASYQADLPFAGVLANRVGSTRHGEILKTSLAGAQHWFGALPREAAISLPSRHLGLVQAGELADLEARLEAAAALLAQSIEAALPPAVDFEPAAPLDCPRLLEGVRIGVARDAAFAFVYPANLDLLRELGAQLHFFSPLVDHQLPEVDSLYLPGGYPELHLAALERNHGMREAIRAHHVQGKPILAECGGMLYLLESLSDVAGQRGQMLGLLPGEAQMQPKLVTLAMQAVSLPEGVLRGHSYHHSQMSCPLTPVSFGECPNYRRTREPLYQVGRLTASYVHFYLPSAPRAAAALLAP
ncbi:cobyrinate a,c-diamide synthase [Pseudomonas sp. NW5]|uniref:cobyrinate a,c-diamide synthase n=1 Tax=Pseudomonas sp. NW5 TaxID=2934934 RepID=UPI0020203914|nr:cobyrinate a,c-diamide synthase [Pseudomonas sp. NW5]MCL7462515.1 cobyrinate a,c-diamide synthase [Pseudomonas sp. NW5]